MSEKYPPDSKPVDAILKDLAEKIAGLSESERAPIAAELQRLNQCLQSQNNREEEIHRKREADLFQNLKKDIADRKRAEEALRVALSNLDIFVYNLDKNLRYTWAYNPRFHFRVDVPQVLGKRDDELFPPDAIRELVKIKQDVIDTGQRRQEEVKIFMNGEWGYYLVTLEPVRDADGKVIGLNGATMNVTQQHIIESEHQEAIIQKEIHHRIIEQREKERQSYARDIHDGPVQTLSSISFSLQYIKEAFPDPALRLELDQVSLSIKSAVQELRELINDLRPPSLIRFGLAKAIQMNAEDLRERYPAVQWHFKLENDGQLLPEPTCLALFRIYQEAINNIIRHSAASKAWIEYQVKKDRVALKIRDNGIGFTSLNDMVQLTQTNHFGLAGMIERSEAIGGEINIHSEPGHGTTIQVKVKIHKANE